MGEAARLFSCLWRQPCTICSGAVLNFACTVFSEVVASASQLCYLVGKRSGAEQRVGEGEGACEK